LPPCCCWRSAIKWDAGSRRWPRQGDRRQGAGFIHRSKGFKQLYEADLNKPEIPNEKLVEENKTLTARVEEYRKKAAGFGGLFSSGGKRADAMYALLLENEALEEALYHKMKAETGAHRFGQRAVAGRGIAGC